MSLDILAITLINDTLSLHYAKVVMGRRTFKYTAIQRKISLSLSIWLSFDSNSLCKKRKIRKIHISKTLTPHFCYKGVFAKKMHKVNIVALIEMDFLRRVLTLAKKNLHVFVFFRSAFFLSEFVSFFFF